MIRFLLPLLLLSASIFGQESVSVPSGKFGPPLNTQNAEYCPVIAPNARYLVFQSNRPGGEGGMDLWISENKNFRNRTEKPIWGEPANFRELNTTGFEGPFSILFDADGKPLEIFFTSQKDPRTGRTGLAGLNLYSTRNLTRKNPATDRWSVPEHLIVVNTNFDEKMPAISPDGKSLVFSSNRPGGLGGFDLWISNRDSLESKWSEPVNLGRMFNSRFHEIMPSYHYDGLSLFFSSDRNDENHKFSFYMANFEDPSLSYSEEELADPLPLNSPKKPKVPKLSTLKKLPPPFNSLDDDEGITLTHDGLWVFYSSNRKGGEGQFDIYRAPVTEELRKPYAFELYGVVVDGSESLMIGLDSTLKISNGSGTVKIITSRRIGGDITTKEANQKEPVNFRTRILTGDVYKVEVSSPGFHPNQFSLDLRGTVGFKKSKYVKVILMPLEEEKKEPEETPVAKKEVPEKEPEVIPPSKSQSVLVLLKDFTTKKPILNGKVILIHEKAKDGTDLPKEKEGFLLEALPTEAFELMASAKGYKPETLIVPVQEETYRKAKEIEIFLQKKGDYPAIYDTPILFEFNEFKILESQKKYLNAFVKFLKANPSDEVELGGHTDNVASKEYNLPLSEKRAVAIKEYLVKKGIAESRIQTKGYWYSQPAADNSAEEGRAKNRRVTFKKLK
jgi:peptidoglycan-associated lipoprotein